LGEQFNGVEGQTFPPIMASYTAIRLGHDRALLVLGARAFTCGSRLTLKASIDDIAGDTPAD
jgi:hypothetical protein